MRAGDYIIKKCLVVLFTAIYLLIAVSYLVFLPKYNPLRIVNNRQPVKSQLILRPTHVAGRNAANMLLLIHRTYRATVENKRQMFYELSQMGLNFVLVLAGGVVLICFLRFVVKPVKMFHTQQHTYLNYCALRI